MTTATASPSARLLEDPPKTRRASARPGVTNPYTSVIKQAMKNPGRWHALTGKYSVRPYEGRKNANESFTVMSQMHAAARALETEVRVRRWEFDADSGTCEIKFKIPVKGEKDEDDAA
jgi:hypothetical protein